MYKLVVCNIGEFSEAQYDDEYAKLTDTDKNRIDKLKSNDSKHRTLAGRMLARKAVAQLTCCDGDKLEFCIDDRGKPYIKDSEVFFSISHCDEWVVCAASSKPIGADIERIRPVSVKFAKRVCTENELKYVVDENVAFDILDDRLTEKFFEVWTLKEAYFKLIGTGITDLKSIDTLSDIPHKYTQRMNEYLISVVTE